MTDDVQYNLSAIRELLLAAFSVKELRRLFLEHQDFQSLRATFGPDIGSDDIIDQVFEYSRTQLLWDELLAAVQGANPTQYERFAARIFSLDGAAYTPRPPARRARTAFEPMLRTSEEHTRSLGQALFVLSGLMQDPKVRHAVVAFGADFEAASYHANELFECKHLHDRLHDLEFLCYTPISIIARHFPDDDGVVEAIANHQFYLVRIADELQELVERPGYAMAEASWVGIVFRAQDSLNSATTNLDARLLTESLRHLRRVLTTQPTRINAHLIAAAKSLRLSALIQAMTTLNDSLAQLELEADKMSQFEAGVEALVSLEQSLTAQVEDHNQWQHLDLSLRRIEAVLSLDTEELTFSWPELKAQSRTLLYGHSEPWATRFQGSIERLDDAIDAGNPNEIRQQFREFWRQASERFYRVDRALKRQCQDLSRVGEPLAAVLRMLE